MTIPQTLKLNQQPPTAPTPPPILEQANNIIDEVSQDDFLNDTHTAAKLDAETFAAQEAAARSNTEAAATTEQPPIYDTSNTAAPDPLTAEQARGQTEMLMRGRDMIQQRALAFLAKEPDKYKDFAMSNSEIDMLCEAYGDLVGKMGKIPDWLNIAIAEACVMVPKIAKIFQYRKLKEQNELLKEQNQRLKKKLEAQEAAAATIIQDMPSMRPDFKKYWQLDNNGYYLNDSSGTYLPAEKRTEKPIINEVTIPILEKHNGKEKVKKLFLE